MIRSIVHTGLKAFFYHRKALPASLLKHRDEFCYWLTILNAVTGTKDLKLAGSHCIKVGSINYRLVIDGLGEFTFVIMNQDIESLNFKQA